MVAIHTAGRSLRFVFVALITLAVLATQSQAAMYDLTTAGSSADINGAKFMTADIAPTGTGNIHSFVRIHGKGAEDGYNTDAKKFAYDEVGGHTHSLLLSIVPVVQLTPGGPSFYEFGLDINENGKNPLVSLDGLMIFRESSPALVDGTGTAVELAALGTPLWNLDVPGAVPPVDNWLKLNYDLNAGSGKGDLYTYIPTSALAGGTGDYLYLYSRFGDNLTSTAGFEEWFVRTSTTPPPVPAPAAVLLGMLGMSVAGWRLRRFA